MISKKYLVRPRCGGLLPKTAFTITWMTIVAGTFSILMTMVLMRERAESNTMRELGELLDTVASTVQIACFAEDEALAAEVVRGLLSNSAVLGVVIRANNHDLARNFRTLSGAVDTVATTIPALEGRLTRRVASPFDPEQTVGEIVLEPDPAAISRSVADDVQFVGLLLGVQWVVIGGGLLVLVLLNVVRPMKILSDRLHRMDAKSGERLTPPAGQENTEIGRLARDINDLAAVLVGAIDHATEQTRHLLEAKEQVDVQARQLETKNAALARAMQVQEEVERIARHDLKTPLNSIAAIPALLRRNWRPDKDEEVLLTMIENSAKRVLRMVSLSLDMFRMEEGCYAFNPKAVDISTLVLGITRELADEARAQAVDFQVSGDEPPVWVYAEEILCYSILANLLKNALEAAPPGTTIGISIQPSLPVRLFIRNEGAVPPSVRESFFDKYTTYGKNQGMGLGTYSARLMARIQLGELRMETSEIAGTTLELELLPLPEWETPGVAPRAGLGALATLPDTNLAIPMLCVLLVDDDPDNTLIMKLFLPSPPLQIVTASNGREAVEACRRQRPDVIFMDLEMPIMGGFDALRRIRTLQLEQGVIGSTIIAFSAHDDEASRRRSVTAGFDLHLGKPCSQHEILKLLASLRSGGRRVNAAPEGLPEATVWIDEDLFAAIPGFLESRRAPVALLRQTLESGDREFLRQLAHKLKGSFGMYGFKWAAQICRELEDNYRSADLKILALQVDALEQHLAHVKISSRAQMRGIFSVEPGVEVEDDASKEKDPSD